MNKAYTRCCAYNWIQSVDSMQPVSMTLTKGMKCVCIMWSKMQNVIQCLKTKSTGNIHKERLTDKQTALQRSACKESIKFHTNRSFKNSSCSRLLDDGCA